MIGMPHRLASAMCKRWLRSPVCGQWLRRRQRGQEFVEFGLIIVSLAIVGVAGLTVMGRAEAGYFIPLQSEVDQGKGGGGSDVAHHTYTSMNCTPTMLAVNATVTCSSITVVDYEHPKSSPPAGTVQLVLDGTPLTPLMECTLVNVDAVQTSQCTTSLTWQAADATKPHTLVGRYVPTDAHLSSDSPGVTITVLDDVLVSASCVGSQFGGSDVEVGHPMKCTAIVKDKNQLDLLGNPKPYARPIAVTWTPAGPSAAGFTYLYCFTNGAPSSGPFMNSCAPPAQGAAMCTTDPATGSCTISYRRSYDDLQNVKLGPDKLHVNVLLASTDAVFNVSTPGSPHPAQMVVSCAGPYVRRRRRSRACCEPGAAGWAGRAGTADRRPAVR